MFYVTALAVYPSGGRWVSVICHEQSQIQAALESVSANEHCPQTSTFTDLTIHLVPLYEPPSTEIRSRLDAAAKRVSDAMALWVDAVIDRRIAEPEQRPALVEVNRLENQMAVAYSHFTGEVARTLLGMDTTRLD